MPTCDNCSAIFPAKMVVDGKVRSFYTRRYCLACSPFGAHNTGPLAGSQTLQERRVKNSEERRRQSASRAIKRRQGIKLRAVAHKGGACSKCGYNRCVGALEFHHLDPEQKSFSVAAGSMWKWETLEAELEKCVLLCANCHREAEDEAARGRRSEDRERPIAQKRVEERRRQVALMAVAVAGGRCALCGYDSCVRALEFHHRDPARKAFTVRNGNTWSWARVQEELGKCTLLCANCHREAEAREPAAAHLRPGSQAGAASTCTREQPPLD